MAIALTVVVAACQALPEGGTPRLEGSGWRAVEVGARAPIAGREPTAAFDRGRISGSTGCNAYGGEAIVRGSNIEIRDVAMTKIACVGATGDVEARFNAILGSAATVAIRADGFLVLSGSDGDLVLRPDPGVGP